MTSPDCKKGRLLLRMFFDRIGHGPVPVVKNDGPVGRVDVLDAPIDAIHFFIHIILS